MISTLKLLIKQQFLRYKADFAYNLRSSVIFKKSFDTAVENSYLNHDRRRLKSEYLVLLKQLHKLRIKALGMLKILPKSVYNSICVHL